MPWKLSVRGSDIECFRRGWVSGAWRSRPRLFSCGEKGGRSVDAMFVSGMDVQDPGTCLEACFERELVYSQNLIGTCTSKYKPLSNLTFLSVEMESSR